MAVTLELSGSVLNITGNAQHDTVSLYEAPSKKGSGTIANPFLGLSDVFPVADRLTVSWTDDLGQSGSQTYNTASLTKIVFRGNSGNDVLKNVDNPTGSTQFQRTTLDGGWFTSVLPSIEAYGGLGNDQLWGGPQSDQLFGGGGADTLYGGSGVDTLYGGSGPDTTSGSLLSMVIQSLDQGDVIHGGPGADVLWGNHGNDRLDGGAGDDVLKGGAGNDTYDFNNKSVEGGVLGVDRIHELSGTDTLYFADMNVGVNVDLAITTSQAVNEFLTLQLPFSNTIENVNGTSYSDVIRGNALDNVLYGWADNDYLYGRAGNDTLYGWSGIDRLEGGLGDDVLVGNAGNDRYVFNNQAVEVGGGSLGSDRVYESTGAGTDELSFYMNRGVNIDLASTAQQVVNEFLNLRLSSGDAIEDVSGTYLADVIRGNALDNRIFANQGDDSLYGMAGNDTLVGGADRDRLEGGPGNDALSGGEGDDHYHFINYGWTSDNPYFDASLGVDTLNEGPFASGGNDTLHFSLTPGSMNRGIDLDLASTAPQPVHKSLTLRLSDGAAVENVSGTAYADVIRGNALDNHLRGNDGNDTLFGREGSDTLYGGFDNDSLFGGADNNVDYLDGGSHDDRFLMWHHAEDASYDKISGPESNDVAIRFRNRGSAWTDQEISVLDAAFAELQTRAGSTRILKDPVVGESLEFLKKDSSFPYPGGNYLNVWPFGLYSDREISIRDWDETSAAANKNAKGTAIHEIAHNWQDINNNRFWNVFWGLNIQSGADGDYASDYGRKNVYEDWATVWETYFHYLTPASRSTILMQKLSLVDQFFNEVG